VRLDLDAIPVPPVFGWLSESGGVAEAEMLRTFNCGIGMIVVAGADQAEAVLQRLREAGENPIRIGETIVHEGGDPVRTAGRLTLR
jgi:phosphoribosylformylglycinamidine cyclo-ligase